MVFQQPNTKIADDIPNDLSDWKFYWRKTCLQIDWSKVIVKDFKRWRSGLQFYLESFVDCWWLCENVPSSWCRLKKLKISKILSIIAVSANYLTKIGPTTGFHAHECRSWASHSTTTVERVEMPATDAYNHASTTSWNVLVGYRLFYITWWCKYFPF